MQLTAQQRQSMIEHIRQHCAAEVIILLGSAARGELRLDSDVDIAYMAKPHAPNLTGYRRFRIAQELAELVKRDVDLIDFEKSSTVFQLQIVTTGQIVYERDHLPAQLAWLHAYRDYALLGDWREPFITAWQKGGTPAMNRDIVLNKAATIRHCVSRIKEEYADDTDNLYNLTRQDSIILNLQRACEGCLDLAMHLISEQKLGIPQSTRDAFDLLQRAGIIERDLNASLKAMIGFRNIAMHDYQAVQVEILEEMIEEQLPDFERFILSVEQSG